MAEFVLLWQLQLYTKPQPSHPAQDSDHFAKERGLVAQNRGAGGGVPPHARAPADGPSRL
jgi:hypothetical protein